MPRYLTKSRFKIGLSCPTKLFYTKKEKTYPNNMLEDAFLAALADGGIIIGELAKSYHEGGHDIVTLDYEEAEKQTKKLLELENVTILEAAIRYENLFIRIDVLVKRGNHFSLKEVKAKSFDSNIEEPFLNKNGTIQSKWKPYLYDVSFQHFVLQSAYPDSTIDTFLSLTDKNALCPTEGLNQKFRIVKDDKDRKGVKVSSNLNKEDLVVPLLLDVDVNEFVDQIYENWGSKDVFPRSFVDEIEYLSNKYFQDEKIKPQIGSHCRDCEFKCSKEDESNGLKNGFKECWAEAVAWKDKDFEDPSVLDLWASKRKNRFIDEGKLKLIDLDEDDVEPKADGKNGMSASERQWLQVEKIKENDQSIYIDKFGLKEEFKKFVWPWHVIDFETATVPIGFNKSQKPYSTILFEFSHHILNEDGSVEHVGEFLSREAGRFPNFDFIRELKKQLENDNGTIFMYSAHENTCLNAVYRQLKETDEDIPDRDELCDFIKTITYSSGSTSDKWIGERAMVDQLMLVKRFYFDPWCNGSNSIKQILPSVLRSSNFLKERYSKPIYGATGGIKSLNFENWTWLEIENGEVKDPYKKLPKLFQNISDHDLEILTEDDELRSGGAALTSFSKMQYSEMSDYERKELEAALLKYCETDTMACVMVLQAWVDWLR